MRWFSRRVMTLVMTLGLLVGVGTALAPSASAATIELHWLVNASTHIARTGSDVTVTGGRFDGTVDLETGRLTGRMSLPPSTLTVNLLGLIPTASVTVQISPVGPTTGQVDFSNLTVSTRSSFDIRVTNVTPQGTDVNLVGDRCKTSEPITISLGGTVDLEHGSTFSGVFTIPDFESCQGFELALNELIPGPGNTFSATFAPEGGATPPPPEPAPPPPSPPPAPLVQGGLEIQIGPQTITTPPIEIPAPPPIDPLKLPELLGLPPLFTIQ